MPEVPASPLVTTVKNTFVHVCEGATSSRRSRSCEELRLEATSSGAVVCPAPAEVAAAPEPVKPIARRRGTLPSWTCQLPEDFTMVVENTFVVVREKEGLRSVCGAASRRSRSLDASTEVRVEKPLATTTMIPDSVTNSAEEACRTTAGAAPKDREGGTASTVSSERANSPAQPSSCSSSCSGGAVRRRGTAATPLKAGAQHRFGSEDDAEDSRASTRVTSTLTSPAKPSSAPSRASTSSPCNNRAQTRWHVEVAAQAVREWRVARLRHKRAGVGGSQDSTCGAASSSESSSESEGEEAFQAINVELLRRIKQECGKKACGRAGSGRYQMA